MLSCREMVHKIVLIVDNNGIYCLLWAFYLIFQHCAEGLSDS